jgi:hypothetical protein
VLLPKGRGRHGCTESDHNYSGAWDEHLCNCEQPESPDENKRPEALSLAAIRALVPRSTGAQHANTEAWFFRCSHGAEGVSRKGKILFGLSCRNGILYISQAYFDKQKY